MATTALRPKLAGGLVAAVLGFAVVTGARSQPADPGARLPQSYRLADLIGREQETSAGLQRQATQLQRAVDAERATGAGSVGTDQALADAGAQAGLSSVKGPGVRVTLDDSTLSRAPSGDINDLVIHSGDVQAVVNALWRAGAQAMAINGQRLIVTSAVLCVGNTLLLDRSVHSPPYVVIAVGADRGVFDADQLVRRLHHDADVLHLGFSVERVADLEVTAYPSPVSVRYASPAG